MFTSSRVYVAPQLCVQVVRPLFVADEAVNNATKYRLTDLIGVRVNKRYLKKLTVLRRSKSSTLVKNKFYVHFLRRELVGA